MKTRNGFVSNSSSSSFVILGVKMKYEDLGKLYGITDDDDDELFDKVEEDPTFKMLWEENIFGIVLGRSSDNRMDKHEYTLDEINAIEQKIKDFTGKNNIKLYTLEVQT